MEREMPLMDQTSYSSKETYINIYKGSNIKEAADRIKNQNYQGKSKEYKCSGCKDTGIIAGTYSGEVASIDIPASQTTYYRICKCRAKIDAEESLKRTGLNIEEYRSKTFKTFNTDSQETINMKKLAIDYINDPNARSIGYFGKSGTGKTHICIAICNELNDRGIPHKYFSYRTEIKDLKALLFKEEAYKKKIEPFLEVSVLYIDDLFKLAQNNNGTANIQELQITYDIINSRYINKKRTVISSEMTVKEITNIDTAIGSRIYEMVNPYGMKCDGENRRFKG